MNPLTDPQRIRHQIATLCRLTYDAGWTVNDQIGPHGGPVPTEYAKEFEVSDAEIMSTIDILFDKGWSRPGADRAELLADWRLLCRQAENDVASMIASNNGSRTGLGVPWIKRARFAHHLVNEYGLKEHASLVLDPEHRTRLYTEIEMGEQLWFGDPASFYPHLAPQAGTSQPGIGVTLSVVPGTWCTAVLWPTADELAYTSHAYATHTASSQGGWRMVPAVAFAAHKSLFDELLGEIIDKLDREPAGLGWYEVARVPTLGSFVLADLLALTSAYEKPAEANQLDHDRPTSFDGFSHWLGGIITEGPFMGQTRNTSRGAFVDPAKRTLSFEAHQDNYPLFAHVCSQDVRKIGALAYLGHMPISSH